MSRPVMIRTSERRAFKRCPQRWWWGWREGLRPTGPISDKLWFGIGWHATMAYWYRGPGRSRGADPLGFWRKWVADEIRFIRTVPFKGAEYKEEVYVDAAILGEQMLTAYLNEYGIDRDWWMIAPEQTFNVRIELPPGSRRKYIQYPGTFDGVFRMGGPKGDPWLAEHKTAKTIRTTHLPMDDQGGAYWAVATTTLRNQGLIGPKERLHGIMYNFARKAKPDDRPKDEQGRSLNKDGTVSARQPTPLFKREPVERTLRERNTQIRRIGSEALVMEQFRNGRLPLIKNPTTDCSWDCEFFTLCELHEAGAVDLEQFKQQRFRVEDPYADHRKSAGEGGD